MEELQCLVEQMREHNVDLSKEELSCHDMVLWIKEGNMDEVLEFCNMVFFHSNKIFYNLCSFDGKFFY